MKKNRIFLAYFLSVVSLFLIWIIIAGIINAPLILPGPFEVLKQMGFMLVNKTFWGSFAFTFLRIIISFVISVILGTGLGIVCGLWDFAKKFFEIPLSIVRATPVIAFILIALFWCKSGTVPVFVSVLMTLPIMVTSVVNGFSKPDAQLMAMAKVYNFTKKQVFKQIQLPSVIPFFFNGLINCFGLTWKVVVAGEVLSLPVKGIGTMLQRAQVHLETSTVIAVTIILVLFSFILEKLLTFCVKKYVKD